jgi:hypothetical protein
LEEELSLPREVADPSNTEILPESKIDEDETSVSMPAGGGYLASGFDDKP